MLNHVFIEGYVASSWKYGNDLFLKVAVYRDPDLPAMEQTGDGKQIPDYVLAKLPNGGLKGIAFEKNQQVRIEGFLQSHDIDETLEDFLSRSNFKDPKAPRVEIVGGTSKDIVVQRSSLEVTITKYDLVFTRREKTEQSQEPARKPDLKPAPKSVSAETTGKKKK
jgi:hypothetical protein